MNVTSDARLKKREALGDAVAIDAELDLREGEHTASGTAFTVEDPNGVPQVWIDDRPGLGHFRR